ncbi:hypothetical protein Bbelb_018490 [Branchiostoma belcheri]|nr:hypothetical protein Bbelb_018490 [Branchiostoma belcheri]
MCPGSGGSDFSGAGQRSPGSGKGGPRSGCSGIPRTGTAGPREWEQRVPGTGATGPESGAATHGAVHGHFLPCTGMYRDRVRAYNVQYTTCTQKVVHFRECTGHVRDWTRFVCSLSDREQNIKKSKPAEHPGSHKLTLADHFSN